MEITTTTTQYVTVKNRNNGYTGYTLPNGVKKQFTIGQTRNIDINELKELRDCDGGEYILKNYLIIDDKTALDFLDLHPEPEYFYTENEIKELLTTGSLEQLEDALNFAPQGVIDIIKDMGVKIELPDTRKRKMIFEKTGFSIDNAIMVNEILSENNNSSDNTNTDKPQRKAEAIQPKATGRKAAPITTQNKYNIVE